MGVWDWFRRTFGSRTAEQPEAPQVAAATTANAAPTRAAAPRPPKPPREAEARKPPKPRKPARDKPKKPNKGRGGRASEHTAPPPRTAPVVVRPEPEPAPVVAAPAPVAPRQPAPEPQPVATEPPTDAPRPRESRGQELLAWVVVPKLEGLLADVDAVPEDAERDTLVRVRARFVREWRAVGKLPAEHVEALEAARDERLRALDARLATFPDPRAEELARHLEAREALIADALALAAHPDLKGAIERAKGLQRRWREAPRLSRDDLGDLADRFKAAIDGVFARRDEERALRLSTLSALVSSAEALPRAADPVRAAEAMKQLQARWKETGGVRGEEGDALWTRFRAAADAVFERRRAHIQAEHEANMAAREALIAEAEAAATDLDGDADEVIRQLMRRWRRVGFVPREQGDALWERFRAACDRLREPEPIPYDTLGDEGPLRYRPFAALRQDFED